MTRVGENERETLRQAAEAAQALLPKAEQDRARAVATIERLRAVVSAWEAISGKRPKKPEESASGEVAPKVKRGQVAEHVEAILRSGGDYEEPEIRKLIAERFHVTYGRPSIYSALRRGIKPGKYELKEGRWRIKS